MKKMITKKPKKNRMIADSVSKASPVKKKTHKNKVEKKETIKGKNGKKIEKKQKKNKPPPNSRSSEVITPKTIDPPKPVIPETPITPGNIARFDQSFPKAPDVQLIPAIQSGGFIPKVPKINILTILSFISVLLFFLGGYLYPATSSDRTLNDVIWAGNDGKYDRGLFSQFYASIGFTFGVMLLGYYVNATFIRYNIKYWNYFLIGILLMFFFGLGKIGELIFNHTIFEGFKNFILPIALMILAFASYKIYKNMAGGI